MSKTYHHGDLKNAVVHAAREQIRVNGAASLNLRAIARDIGVTHPAVYRHFKDKDALLQELATVGFNELADRLELVYKQLTHQESTSDTKTKLHDLAKTYVNFSLDEPELISIMFSLIPVDVRMANETLYLASKRSFALLIGSIADKDGDEVTNAVVVWSLFHGLGQLSLARQITQLEDPKKREEIIAKAVTVLAKGLT